MTDPWACIDCGHRQAGAGKCLSCREDTVDLRVDENRQLVRDVDARLKAQSDTRRRWIGVVVGMAVVITLWFVPGYWTIERAFALPFMFDQWLLMAAIGMGVMFVLGRFYRPRFAYLNDLP